MIVDHLGYGFSGGAAKAALRIHEGLRKAGIDSRYWHAPGLSRNVGSRGGASSKDHSGPEDCSDYRDDACRPLRWPELNNGHAWRRSVSKASRLTRDWSVKLRHLRHRPTGFEYFSTGQLRRATPWPVEQLCGDVLVLHWIGKLLDYPTFFESLPKDQPVVWVLHDMNPFTGGCHFSAGCDRYTQACGHCPQIAGASARDITCQTLAMKRRLYEKLNLHVVAPSRWLSAAAQRSIPFAKVLSHRVIPYGLETERFRPMNQQQARRALGLDQDKPTVLFGAASIENRRKGAHWMIESWAELRGERVQGILFGAGSAEDFESSRAAASSSDGDSQGAPIRHLGFIDDPERLRMVYSAADVFVLPSEEDNLPQTGLEAMACGTPVVAFDAGGIPDFVRPGQTGLLAPTGDGKALVSQILRLLRDQALRRQFGSNARQMVVREYAQPLETARYAEFLASLCQRPPRSTEPGLTPEGSLAGAARLDASTR